MTDIIRPSKKILLLKPVSLDSFGGSILTIATTETKDKPQVGELVAVGSGKTPMPVKIGDYIAYRKYGESAFLVKGQEYIFVGFDDVLGVIKNDKGKKQE
jgi:chaperonin GroES